MPAGILKSVYSQELYSSQLARFHVMMKNYFLTYWNHEIKIDYYKKERSQSQGKVKGNSDKSLVNNNVKLWQSNHTFKGLLSLQGSPLICFKVKVPNFLGISSPYCWQLTSACYHIRKVMFFRFSDMDESESPKSSRPLFSSLPVESWLQLFLFLGFLIFLVRKVKVKVSNLLSHCWQLTPTPLCFSIQALPGRCNLQSKSDKNQDSTMQCISVDQIALIKSQMLFTVSSGTSWLVDKESWCPSVQVVTLVKCLNIKLHKSPKSIYYWAVLTS